MSQELAILEAALGLGSGCPGMERREGQLCQHSRSRQTSFQLGPSVSRMGSQGGDIEGLPLWVPVPSTPCLSSCLSSSLSSIVRWQFPARPSHEGQRCPLPLLREHLDGMLPGLEMGSQHSFDWPGSISWGPALGQLRQEVR